MGKTDDLAVVQKTPSIKRVSHRGSLLKGVALHRVLKVHFTLSLEEQWRGTESMLLEVHT